MSNIIWKGVNSNDVSGLLITNLPAIKKAKMKTLITNIDGLDGDVIEDLGYQSYTKTINIALTRNFDIDYILNYFDSSGELILSNEPTKKYNAKIIDAIDYNKLIRFKTASIKFYVQPFKYLIEETSFEWNIEKNSDLDYLEVINQGYIDSKPIITIYGSGYIELMLNDLTTFTIEMDTDFVVIDSTLCDAYCETDLKNRNMDGIFPLLKSGINTIKWTGNITKIIVDPKSRWV